MRNTIALIALLACGCSGSLNVIDNPDASPEASNPDVAVSGPCSSTATTLAPSAIAAGTQQPLLAAGGWVYWASFDSLYGMAVGSTESHLLSSGALGTISAFASDGTTLYAAGEKALGVVTIGAMTTTTYSSQVWKSVVDANYGLAVDGSNLYWGRFSNTYEIDIYAVDKTKLDTATPQMVGSVLQTGPFGAFHTLAINSTSLFVSSARVQTTGPLAGGVTVMSKTGQDVTPISTSGALGVIADDTTVMWIDGSGATFTAPVTGGTPAQKLTGSSEWLGESQWFAQNATSFFASGASGVYRISKSDGSVTKLSSESAGFAVAADSACVYYTVQNDLRTISAK